jgi:galactonate dehydratase
MRYRVSGKEAGLQRDFYLNRRNFLKSTAGASAAALLATSDAEAAGLPQAKITAVRIYEGPTVMPLQIPLLQSSMVVMIDTDIGITGIGEGGSPDSLSVTAARLIGQNPWEITKLWQDMYRSYHYPPGKERLHAIGALDLALWDLKGKALDAPVYELLGGSVRNYMETYTTGFRGTGTTMQERARECIEAGYRFYRFDAASVSGGNTYDTRERVARVAEDCFAAREGVGPYGNYMVDFHQRFTFPDALRCCKMIEETHPYFVEDPVEFNSFQQDIPLLRRSQSNPLGAGEEWGDRYDFIQLVENHDLDYLRTSLPNTGGITELIRIMAICESHDVGIVPHFTGPIATAAQAHALATFPATVVFEYNYQSRNVPYLQQNWIDFREGKVYTNDRPGLGIEVDTSTLRHVATYDQGNNRPMYYRPDGSPITW